MLNHTESSPPYETPRLQGPSHLYETPLLLDVEEAASCNWGCLTSGDAPAPDIQIEV